MDAIYFPSRAVKGKRFPDLVLKVSSEEFGGTSREGGVFILTYGGQVSTRDMPRTHRMIIIIFIEGGLPFI